MNAFSFGRHKIGAGAPVFIIAELSANHGGSLDRALETIRAFHAAGADAVKLQTYTPDTMTIPCDKPPFVIKGGLWNGRTLYDLYREAHTPWAWHPRLMTEAANLGLACFSTPFDATSLDFLENIGMELYKVASFECGDIPLLKRIGATRKPVILSTGMSTLEEISNAVRTLRAAGCTQLALLKCTSAYPAPLEEMNLLTLRDLAKTFSVPCGLSDHTLGHTVAVASVALGGTIIEKHAILRRSDGGPDSAFSMEPQEFREMVKAIRDTERALGQVSYGPTPGEVQNKVFRRSIFVVRDVHKGEELNETNLRIIRPGHGLAPAHWDTVVGKVATREIKYGTPLNWDLVSL